MSLTVAAAFSGTPAIELSPKRIATHCLDGYPSFAEFIARDGDAAVYRKFRHLGARNLLYRQSELHSLEEQLRSLDSEDAACLGDEDALKAAREWCHMSDPTNLRSRLHLELQDQIALKLREYREALVLESKVLAFRQPDKRTLSVFKKWFSSGIPVLWGRDKDIYDNEGDLAALAPIEPDRLNLFLQRNFGWLFRQEYAEEDLTHNRNLHMFYYSHDRIQVASAILSILFSAVLLIGAIVCLLSTSDSGRSLQIGILVLFTCLFAIVVGLLTNARRAEIFGATAAYAAVLVVFISNNLTGHTSATSSQ